LLRNVDGITIQPKETTPGAFVKGQNTTPLASFVRGIENWTFYGIINVAVSME